MTERTIILVDINVFLDVLLRREPFLGASAGALETLESGASTGYVSGHTLPTLYYLVRSARGEKEARMALATLLELVRVVELPTSGYREALTLPIRDYEDALQAAAALHVGADYLVTRNEKDFRGVPGLKVLSPERLLRSVRER